MSLAGKVNDFTRDDLLTFARTAGVNRLEAQRVMGQVFSAVSKWREFADEAGVDGRKVKKRTLANLSKWPPTLVEGLRVLLD